MKRSEMADVITRCLPNMKPDKTLVAKVVLKAIEKAGMLPPSIEVKTKTIGWVPINKWEPENEEN
jgi:hypothetical protein